MFVTKGGFGSSATGTAASIIAAVLLKSIPTIRAYAGCWRMPFNPRAATKRLFANGNASSKLRLGTSCSSPNSAVPAAAGMRSEALRILDQLHELRGQIRHCVLDGLHPLRP